MKKLLLSFAALLLGACAFAKVGFIGGFTTSNMEIEHADMQAVNAYNAGLAARFETPFGLAFQPQVTYNVKGSTWEEVKSTLGFLEAGVQLQYGADLIAFKPYVFAEPFVGYALTGESDFPTYDFDEIENKLEYGFAVGVGAMILGEFQISAKYYMNLDDCDLNNYMSTVKETVLGGLDRKSFSGFTVSVGFFF